jgi:serine/threonine-protein kinase
MDQLAARLQHPHILTVHDSGESDGQLWFTMPYVEGETLRRRLARERQLPVDEAVRIARETAQALQYAHERGVIHRDIKPENLLLTTDGSVLVADFGIARPVGGSQGWDGSTVTALTEAGLVVGTAAYMSPEQASSDRELDGRSDIYSLGCVLYEMLAGEPPFTGPTAQAVMVRRFTDQVPSARRMRPAVPAGLDAAIRRAMAKSPEERFPSAAAFAEALAAPAALAERLPSVAVLPFISLSPNPENEYFADGITEDVIAQLSKIRSLSVISRASVMPFKKRERSLAEISGRLNVGTVLDGSVRRAGDRVRIVAQLIDATTERHLWSDTYDRDLTDIFAIARRIAASSPAGTAGRSRRAEGT